MQNRSQTSMDVLVQMNGISKAFGQQIALQSVDFELSSGEVHVLAGENGAGKSTLIKILGGVHDPDAGSVRINRRPVRPRSPKDATDLGVAIIHQELSLIPSMSVSDNIFLGQEQSKFGWTHHRDQQIQTESLLKQLGLHVDPTSLVGDLPISAQQMIEIAKALSRNSRILIMDEATSALNDPEVAALFNQISRLKADGCGIIYITHKLEEIYRLADRITVLRDGRRIITERADSLSHKQLIFHMIGRQLPQHQSTSNRRRDIVRLRVSDCTVKSTVTGKPATVNGVSFEVREAEIVGIAGLAGSGTSDLLWAIDGALNARTSAKIEIEGKMVKINSPRAAIEHGIALVTNDRKQTGLVSTMSVMQNTTLAALHRVSRGGWMSPQQERAMTDASTKSLKLQATSIDQSIATLSGGNQQKIVLAKWMNTNPHIILLDEPTRGIDVGAKQEIYQLLSQWSDQGYSILLITSELPEMLLLSDRILVLHRGRIAAEFDRSEATQERILHAAMGGKANVK